MTSVSQPFSLSHFINSIPLPEDEKAARYHYLAYCYGKDKVLGEYYVSLIADFFGWEADKSTDGIQRLSAYLRAYTVVDDDLIDTPPPQADQAWPLLRSFFLDRVRHESDLLTAEGINADDTLESELAVYQHTSAAYAKLHAEPDAKGADDSYTEAYADRMATVRVPILMLGIRARDKALTCHACEGINGLMKALQLLDDLVDLRDDQAAGRLTYPLLCYVALSISTKQEGFFPANPSYGPWVGVPFQPLNSTLHDLVTRKQLQLTTATLDGAIGHFLKGKGRGLVGYANDIRQRVRWALSQGETKGSDHGLLMRVNRSGAAPMRSVPEKGVSSEY